MNLQQKIDLRDRLSREIEFEQREIQEQEYRDTAERLNIRMSEVQLSDGPSVRFWFGHVQPFLAWVKENKPNAKYFEWNTCIYHVNDNNLASPLCRLEHVKP